MNFSLFSARTISLSLDYVECTSSSIVAGEEGKVQTRWDDSKIAQNKPLLSHQTESGEIIIDQGGTETAHRQFCRSSVFNKFSVEG